MSQARPQHYRVLVFGSGMQDVASANCGRALRSMGHEVAFFDPEEHGIAGTLAKSHWVAQRIVARAIHGPLAGWADDAFVRAAERFGPDLVLVTAIHFLSPAVIGRLKRATGAKIAGWFQDAIVNLTKHDFVLADYDGLFFKDPVIVERLRDFGGLENVHYLPEACEPSRHRPIDLSSEDWSRYGCDLMFYGNLYPYRARLLECLDGMPIRFYGGRPGRWIDHPLARTWQGHPIFDDEKVRAVLCAKVVLSTSHFGEVRSVNARVFEVAGIGGFQVADAPGIQEFFEPGREIVTFRGPKELREVVAHYLAAPEERSVIAASGRERAHREHTYARRLARLLNVLGMGPAES